MIFSRTEHHSFLEAELRAQTEAYKQKLDTSAAHLLEREEMFVAQFVRFQDGEMILKFSNNRGLPRLGEYLYCFTVPKDFRDYRNWGNRTYGDLIKSKSNFSESVCIWHSSSEERDFLLAGFRGIELEFAFYIQHSMGMILLLGPNKPPFEYLLNLQKVLIYHNNEDANSILDQDYTLSQWSPVLLDRRKNTASFVLSQLQLLDTLIIQGPPGTGKTYLIAEIIKRLADENKSILVNALTNRALIEIAENPALKVFLDSGRIYKSNLSFDEARTHKNLKHIKEIGPLPGSVILSTFFVTSGLFSGNITEPLFDFVIIDESSQAFLAMFAASKLLGKKNIWVGDTKQLPPVVSLNEDIIKRNNYTAFLDGLATLAGCNSSPVFQLTESYRLSERAVNYTGIFYNETLTSIQKQEIRLNFHDLPWNSMGFLNPNGGPTLIKMKFPIGEYRPETGIAFTASLVLDLIKINENIHISVLSFFVETIKALQRKIIQAAGYRNNLMIETVSRIQGLTTDICIFFIPNTGYHRSLEERLFNVATSRAKRQTIIISDNKILNHPIHYSGVKSYLLKLDSEYSFEIKDEPGTLLIHQK